MAPLDCQMPPSDCKPMLHSETLTPQAGRPASSGGLSQLPLALIRSCQAGDEPSTATDLPATFPHVEPPRFLEGDRLRWIAQGETTDWGRVIGRLYSFAPHHRCWTWCYLIWLDVDSPSAAWVRADIAWESDLEPLEVEAMR
jgi:hypothetical protein